MEVKPAFENFSRALVRLMESYERTKSSKDDYVFFRDSTIQRFEFTRIPEYIDLLLKSKGKLEFKLQEDL